MDGSHKKKYTMRISALLVVVAATTISSSFAGQQDVFQAEVLPVAHHSRLLEDETSKVTNRCIHSDLIEVLLTTNHTKEGLYLQEDLTVPGARQGYSVILNDPNSTGTTIGRYSALTTFYQASVRPFSCDSSGSYTFYDSEDDALPRDQITFSATCETLPYFTITGGQGRFEGANGYVKYRIPHEQGNLHEIHVCKDERTY